MYNDVFEYIKIEETQFKTRYVPISDGYEWNMYEHLRMSTLFRDSKFTKGKNDFSRPFKNIIRRIRNLALVAMDIDVKDVEPFVNDKNYYYKSLVVRKRYPGWATDNQIDTFFDDTIESYEDYGLALSKHANKIAPESVPLHSIAFCDQTDILSGPICLKHQYSPDQLKDMEGKGWKNVDEIITLARNEKTDVSGNVKTNTPGKYIEVYELDGNFPNAWLKEERGETVTDEDLTTYSRQFWLTTFYKNDKGEKKGLTIFAGKGDPKKYKALKRDPIFGRACGFGGIEELFHPQIWTNYDEIRIQEMLDAASKIFHVTDDPGFNTRNNVKDGDNNEVFVMAKGAILSQMNTQPVNLVQFANASARWEEHAQGIGSAYNAQLGESPASGTPFKLQDLVTTQGDGLHEKRKGKIATYFGEIHRDWILDDLMVDMNKEQDFIEELSLEELNYVVDAVITCEFEKYKKAAILNGEQVTEEQLAPMKEQFRSEFMKKGNKHFFSTITDEFKGLKTDVYFNIAGKQKDLAKMADKLTNIFRQIFSNPQGFIQTMQIPGMASTFNEILESSGLSPVNFSGIDKMQQSPPQSPPGQGVPSPMDMSQLQNNQVTK